MTVPRTVYLDTADLITLVQLRGDAVRVTLQRDRLRALLTAGGARLVVSDIALLEIAAGRDAADGLALAQGVPNITAVTAPLDVFGAELRGEAVDLRPAALHLDALASFRLVTKIPGVQLTGRHLAWLALKAKRAWARAHDTSKGARRRVVPDTGASVTAALLRGEVPEGLPPLVVPPAVALAAAVRYALRRTGRLETGLAPIADPKDGLYWARQIADRPSLPVGPTTRWTGEQVRRMPGTALRGAVEYGQHRDLQKPYGTGTLGDLYHMAFVGHVDVATIDRTNHDLTKALHRHLDVAIFRNGNLDAVLDHLERGAEKRP